MVKNVFELYPGGLKKASLEFNKAWEWAIKSYPFSSLADYVLKQKSPIFEKDILGELFDSPAYFRTSSCDMLEGRGLIVERDDALRTLVID